MPVVRKRADPFLKACRCAPTWVHSYTERAYLKENCSVFCCGPYASLAFVSAEPLCCFPNLAIRSRREPWCACAGTPASSVIGGHLKHRVAHASAAPHLDPESFDQFLIHHGVCIEQPLAGRTRHRQVQSDRRRTVTENARA